MRSLLLFIGVSCWLCSSCGNNRPEDDLPAPPAATSCEFYTPFYEQVDTNATALLVECDCQDTAVDLGARLLPYRQVERLSFGCSADYFDDVPLMLSVREMTSEVVTANVLSLPNLRTLKNRTYLETGLPANLFFLDSLREVVLYNALSFPDILGSMPLDRFAMTFRPLPDRNVLLPANLGALTNLQELHVDGMEIAIFTGTETLDGLRKLTLSETTWGRIPQAENIWPNLQRLELDKVDIRGQPPAGLANMEALTTIFVSNSELSTSDVVRLTLPPNLETLALRFCDFELLPEELGNLTRLRDLTISVSADSPDISLQLPATLDQLDSLRAVSLQIRADEFPPELLGLSASLERLVLRDPIGSVPDAIGDFIRLKTLHLTNCALTGLPATIANLADTLEELRLTGNSIEAPMQAQIRAWLPNTDITF